jgi:hypothetical protein
MLLTGNLSIEYLISAGIVLLFGMGWHEYAHAVVANWWGDPTPRQFGRLTPNPLVHINWIGWLMFLIIGFGVLGSVPVNPRLMRDPRWGRFWTSAAGPLSNLLQAIVFAIGWQILFKMLAPSLPIGVVRFLHTFFSTGVWLNIFLFFFNILPFVIPGGMFSQAQSFMPFDGWTMIYSLLPGSFIERKSVPTSLWQNVRPLARFLAEPAWAWRDWMPIMGYITLGIVLFSFVLPASLSPFHFLITGPASRISNFLLGF